MILFSSALFIALLNAKLEKYIALSMLMFLYSLEISINNLVFKLSGDVCNLLFKFSGADRAEDKKEMRKMMEKTSFRGNCILLIRS